VPRIRAWRNKIAPCWTFDTHNIPNAARFNIMEDGKPYSEGLVFRLEDCKPTHCEACGQKLVGA
jgi:hypothetical protein